MLYIALAAALSVSLDGGSFSACQAQQIRNSNRPAAEKGALLCRLVQVGMSAETVEAIFAWPPTRLHYGDVFSDSVLLVFLEYGVRILLRNGKVVQVRSGPLPAYRALRGQRHAYL